MLNREFPYQVTRIGTQASKYFTPVRCCRCGREKVFEAIKALPDEVIAKRFRSWGWLLGRNRNYDICPVCVGVKPENKLAERFKVTVDGRDVPTRAEVAEQAQVKKETVEKSIQAGILKIRIYRDISEDLKAIRGSLEKIAEVMLTASITVPEEKKTPAKKARVSKKKEIQSELTGKG